MKQEEIKKEKAIENDLIWSRPEHAKSEARLQENDGTLYKLSDLQGYEIQDQDPDVRGWEIVLDARKHAGTVKELMVDPN